MRQSLLVVCNIFVVFNVAVCVLGIQYMFSIIRCVVIFYCMTLFFMLGIE
jgi:hypothetical protein